MTKLQPNVAADFPAPLSEQRAIFGRPSLTHAGRDRMSMSGLRENQSSPNSCVKRDLFRLDWRVATPGTVPQLASRCAVSRSHERVYSHCAKETNNMARYSRKAADKIEKVMHELKRGTLKSGSSGKKVTSRKQAIAIGLSEARRAGAKVPARPSAKRTALASRRPSHKSGKQTRTLGAAFRLSHAKDRSAAKSRGMNPRASHSSWEPDPEPGGSSEREFPDAVYQGDPRSG